MSDKCFLKIKDYLAKDGLKDAQIKDIVGQIQAIKDLSKENKALYEKRTSEFIKDLKEYNAAEKLNLILDAKRQKDLIERANNFENPTHGLLSVFEASTSAKEGVVDSVANRRNALEMDYLNTFVGYVRRLPIYETFRTGVLDGQIFMAIDNIAKGLPTDKIDPNVLSIAKAIVALNKKTLLDMQRAGMAVNKMANYVTRQTHNRATLTTLGKDGWVKQVKEIGVDPAVFGKYAGDPDMETKILGEIFDGITLFADEIISDESLGDMASGVFSPNISKQLSQSRVLRFKDGEAAAKYNKEFGSGTLFDSITSDIRKKARTIPLVEKLGSNPEAGFDKVIMALERQYKKEGNDLKLKQLETGKQALRDAINLATGKTTQPGTTDRATLVSLARTMQVAGKLGAAGLNSSTNLATTLAMIRSNTGKNMLGMLVPTVKDFFKSLPKDQAHEIARTAGMFFSEFNDHLMENITGGRLAEVNGTATKFARIMLRATGLTGITNGSAKAYVSVMQREIGNRSTKSFRDLPAHLQGNFKRAGITEADWKVLSQATETLDSGDKILSLTALENLEVKPPKGKSAESFKRELARKIMTYYQHGAELASTTAGAREQRYLLGSRTEDSNMGQVRRLVGQFKGFPLQIMRTMGELKNSNFDAEALARGQKDFAGKPDLWLMAQLTIGMTGIAYITDSLNRLANGDDVKNPARIDTWVAMMIKGGSAGLMGDFVLGEADNAFRNSAKDLLGPTVGTAIDMANIQKKAVRGEKYEKDLTRLIRQNIPLQNVPFIRAGFDYIQHDVLNESLNPGYMNKRLLNERKRRLNGETINNPLDGE